MYDQVLDSENLPSAQIMPSHAPRKTVLQVFPWAEPSDWLL